MIVAFFGYSVILKKSLNYFPDHEATVLDCDSWREALKIVWSFLACLMETD